MSRSSVCLLVVVLGGATGCSDAQSASFHPVAPTPPLVASPPPGGVPREGVPLEIGQTVTGTLKPGDPSCGNELSPDSPEPCQLFVLKVREPGVVTVQVATRGAGPLSLRVNQMRQWGQALTVTIAVRQNFRYEIGVALHDGPHAASQGFELTTSFETD